MQLENSCNNNNVHSLWNVGLYINIFLILCFSTPSQCFLCLITITTKKTGGDEFIYICLVELIAQTNYAFMVWKACDSFTTFTWWYGYISIQGSFSSVGWARKPVSSITLQKLAATCKWTQLDLTPPATKHK